jgi:type II secretory pathway pseudopilin PulG
MNLINRVLVTEQRKRRSRAVSRHAAALRGGGFTLVELLIATGITVLIVVTLGWMLGSLMGSASHATARVDAFRDARAALQMIERDLRNLVRTQWSPDPFSNPTPTPGTVQPLTRPTAYFALDNIYADPADSNPAGNHNQQLYALVAAKTTGSSGDVCAVGYYCRWETDPSPNPPYHGRYTLRRFFQDSATTFTAIQNAGTYAGYSALYTPSPTDAVLAANVWNLKITMYNSTGAVINTYPYICDPGAATPTSLPAAIEISLSAMSPQAAQAVMTVYANSQTAWTNWMNPPTPDYLIAPHAYQFRSRINLP